MNLPLVSDVILLILRSEEDQHECILNQLIPKVKIGHVEEMDHHINQKM